MQRRTDLIMEVHESLTAGTGRPMQGVRVHHDTQEDVEVTRVLVEPGEGAQALGRQPGRYVTLEAPKLCTDGEVVPNVCRVVAHHLSELLPKGEGSVLVVGLGNRQVTPDLVGPGTADQVLSTRGIPQLELLEQVCAMVPGVRGMTGMESSEMVAAVVQQVQPRAVIAVDALAARSVKRLMSTIQLCDTGISPGSGVGNHRHALDEATLGIPVIAIGVPTVVDGATLVCDAVDVLRQQLVEDLPQLAELDLAEHYVQMVQVLHSAGQQIMVTPKGVDLLVQRLCRTLAGGINLALHPALSLEELEQLSK